MKYALIEDGVVKQTQPDSQEGLVKVPDWVFCGMVEDGDSYAAPDSTGKKKRQWRDDELRNFVDPLQLTLRWESLSDEAKSRVSQYRNNLLNYPQADGFPNNPILERPEI